MKEALKYLQAGAIIPVDMETTILLVNALKEALAQPAQEPESCNGRNCAASIKNDFEHSNECIVDTAKVQGWSHAPEAIKAAIALEGAPAQPEQERNFCSRCGKRTADLTVIHTCTPPQEKNK